jgi:hypothetical protein
MHAHSHACAHAPTPPALWVLGACPLPCSFAQHLVSRYAAVDERQNTVQEALMAAAMEEASNGAGAGSGSGPDAFRVPVALDVEDREVLREVSSLAPVVVHLLEGFAAFDAGEFAGHLPWLYPLLVQLLGCGHADVRRAVQAVFADRVTALVLQPGSK